MLPTRNRFRPGKDVAEARPAGPRRPKIVVTQYPRSMLEQRDLKLDLLALGLLTFCVFLGASLFTFNPADPPSTLVYPPRTEIANVCGRSGVR